MGVATSSLCFGMAASVVTYHAVRIYWSPLAKIPKAGFGAGLSRLIWAFPHEYRGTITIDLPKLHERLGHLVRISPNEVSFYSRDTYETVHKVGNKFRKDPRVYGEFVQGGHPALFSLTDPVEHAKRRRVMGQLFSRSKVPQLENLIFTHVENLINSLQAGEKTVDLSSACRALEADIISDFSFGTSINAVVSWSQGQELAMVAKNDAKATWMPALVTFPLLCELWEHLESRLFSIFGFKTSYSKGIEDFQRWCQDSWRLALSTDTDSEKPPVSLPNLIRTLFDSGLPAETALSEARENLGPGTDTTSATLAHILWALAHNHSYQEALFQDLAAIGFSTDMKALESVPRFQAAVKEGIRWAGAAAAMLPRIVPPGGVTLHGVYIPENTVLTSSPIWYLHDKTAFPEPHQYDPYRWLTSNGEAMSEDSVRDRFYIPFSRGANICMGAHFAYLELYISVSQIIRNFVLRHDADSTPIGANGKVTSKSSGWTPVNLPPRKEWVAAVPLEKLQVNIQRRST